MGLKTRLAPDDYIELNLKMKITEVSESSSSAQASRNLYNCLVIQFRDQPVPDYEVFGEYKELHALGLVIFLLSPNEPRSKYPDKKLPFYIVYKSFAYDTMLTSDYLDLLFKEAGFIKRRKKIEKVRLIKLSF